MKTLCLPMEFRIYSLIAVLLSVICPCFSSCLSSTGRTGSMEDIPSLLDEANKSVDARDFDAAMEKALQALALAGDDPLRKVQSLHTIVGIDTRQIVKEHGGGTALL